jgi:restriction system protein
MPIPKAEDMMLPLLKFISDGKSRSIAEAEEHIANLFKLTKEERNTPKPSGGESLFHNRIHWTKFYLKKAGLLESPPRSSFKITSKGADLLKKNVGKIDINYLMQFKEFSEFVKKRKK